MTKYILTGVLVLIYSTSFALDFIPGLKGYGTDTRGPFALAEDPDICIVTSTDITSGTPSASTRGTVAVLEGTFQGCIEYTADANTGKIILFETAGTIHENVQAEKYDLQSNTWIAGQSAPSPGVTFRNIQLLGEPASDVIIQHLRGRLGDEDGCCDVFGSSTYPWSTHKPIIFNTGGSTTVENIVLSHLSLSWGGDGHILIGRYGGTVTNITVADCIISEGMDKSAEGDPTPDSGQVSKGMAYNGYPAYPSNIAHLRNLTAHLEYRAPFFKGKGVMVNNLIYNSELGDPYVIGVDDAVELAYVANYVKSGPSTVRGDDIITFQGTWDTPDTQHKLYLYGNSNDGTTQSSSTDWSDIRTVSWSISSPYTDVKETGETPSTDAPLWPTGLTFTAASEVEEDVLALAGARPDDRDSVDDCIVADVTNTTGAIITAQDDSGSCGDWPTLTENTTTLSIPSDPFTDSGDGYTNIEVWLHGLADDVEGVPSEESETTTTFTQTGTVTFTQSGTTVFTQ